MTVVVVVVVVVLIFALSGNDDISIWELPSLECKAIFKTSNAVMN